MASSWSDLMKDPSLITEVHEKDNEEQTNAADLAAQDDGNYATLKGELLELVKPHTLHATKPPFSYSELVVLAILTSDEPQRGITKKDILAWIFQSFQYYNKQAVQGFVEVQLSQDGFTNSTDKNSLVTGVQEVFHEWGVPLQLVGDGCWNRLRGSYNTTPLSVPPDAGRIFLRNRLEPPRQGVFDFLELPAELRVNIYEQLLTFQDVVIRPEFAPDPSIADHDGCTTYDRTTVFSHFIALDRCCSKHGHTGAERSKELRLQPLFALLTVSKQIYDEANSIFYSTNRFHIGSIDNTMHLVRLISSLHLTNLRSICLNLTPLYFDYEALDCPTYRLTAMKLDNLEVEIEDEDDLFDMIGYSMHQRTIYTTKEVAKIPGFRHLAIVALKAKKVRFHGRCEKIEGYVQREMERSREKDQAGVNNQNGESG